MVHPSIIGDLRPNTRIYRIFPRIYFFELFEEGRNTLIQPKQWDDPFESILLNSPVRSVTGDIESFRFHDCVYGQCWTLESRSDALWQIYSKNSDGIRVRTTIGKLIDSLRAAHRATADESCFIGRVSYKRDKKLQQFANAMFVTRSRTDAIVRSLLLKRRAFRHENEVRLLYIENRETKKQDLVYKYRLDPLEIFDQAMVDGRISWAQFVSLKDAIAKRTGLTKRRIRRSLLYTRPKDFVIHIP